MIVNPVLPGFNPDPSFIRVGNDYYIATSTFEWYPGVQIHHSTDLVNWRFVGRPLNRKSQLDMRGNPDSCGVWAPCLSHADGLFWLVYTDVKRFEGNYKDAHNYIVTSPAIEGPWSDPVRVNSTGFDPSLFHDADGRKWFLQMQWNHRPESFNGSTHKAFDGIIMQEYDAASGRLIGPVHNIFRGSPAGLEEGPHLFFRNGYYHLTVAEGGTGYDHCVTYARSKSITGPYETHPDIHLMTSKHAPDAPVQRAGHGQYVETPDGQGYHSHLMGRPLAPHRRCTLGRETGLQKIVWGDDGWPRLAHGGLVPAETVPSPLDAVRVERPGEIVSRFDGPDLPADFQWLRTPEPDRLFSLTESPGKLRVFGRESIGSWHEFALVARRQEDHRFRAETRLDFAPDRYHHLAGLTHYYNRYKFHALLVTWHEALGRCVTIQSCNGDYPSGGLDFPAGSGLAIGDGPVDLAVEVFDNDLQFFVRMLDGDVDWMKIGPVLDAGVVSDEGGVGEHGSFTGAFVGMLAVDQTGGGKPADFDRFIYKRRA